MATMERVRDRGARRARNLRGTLGAELRDARLAAGLSQRRVARATGLSQTSVSRAERGQNRSLTIEVVALLAAALGMRLHMKTYPEGSPVRDAAQLRLLERLRRHVDSRFAWRSEVPIAGRGDLRAWDVLLDGPARIGIEAESRLHDVQAMQRRMELKIRDARVDHAVLVVAATHHNRAVLREHRAALRSTFPLDTAPVLGALRRGEAPSRNGIVVL